MKKAILQVADTGPLESLVVMLRSVGYACHLPTKGLQNHLRGLGLDTVYEVEHLVRHWGYDRPFALPEADRLGDCDLYVDVKAHRNGPTLWLTYPELKNKTLWYRINGGEPGLSSQTKPPSMDPASSECYPPCPVLTPNQWYKPPFGPYESALDVLPRATYNRAYCCWPPFYRFDEYDPARRAREGYAVPLCLIHRADKWGYGDLIEPVRKLGVGVFGVGSPDGLIQHKEVKERLHHALAMVHLKSNDAPGYALYEALAAGCPIILPERLVWRCRMQELFVHGETCLMFRDGETHAALTPEQVSQCREEIKDHLTWLSFPANNRRIGEAGRARLVEVMWSENRPEDMASLAAFMGRHFGG